MFRKLVSSLPFQPTLLGELAIYSSRLKKEQRIRLIGLVFLILGFCLQIMILSYPPQASLTTNRADIVFGAKTKEDILRAYRQNKDQLGRNDIQEIYNNYGIAEAHIRNANLTTVSDNSNFINVSRSNTKWANRFVPISGTVDGGVYEFPLNYWQNSTFTTTYPAISGLTSFGYKFWILLNGSGNILYEKGANKPRLEIDKKIITNNQVTVGSDIKYEILYKNNGSINANDVEIVDVLPDYLKLKFQHSSSNLNFKQDENILRWEVKDKNGAIAPSDTWHQINIVVTAVNTSKVNDCNNTYIDAANALRSTAKTDSCIEAQPRTCPGTGTAWPPNGVEDCIITCPDGKQLSYSQSCAVPQLTCENIFVEANGLWNQRSIMAKILKQPGAVINNVVLYVNEDPLKSMQKINNETYFVNHTFEKEGKYIVQVKVQPMEASYQETQSCNVVLNVTKPKSEDIKLVASVELFNNKHDYVVANNTTVTPGETIMYRLNIANKSSISEAVVDFNGEYAFDARDILEYAEITDIDDGFLNESSGKISWDKASIQPGQSISKELMVKIKDPLPDTPASQSNPLSYDYSLDSQYGNIAKISLNKPVSKNIEQFVSLLPSNAGSVVTLLLLFVIILAGFFYLRTRVLISELKAIQKDYEAGGY